LRVGLGRAAPSRLFACFPLRPPVPPLFGACFVGILHEFEPQRGHYDAEELHRDGEEEEPEKAERHGARRERITRELGISPWCTYIRSTSHAKEMETNGMGTKLIPRQRSPSSSPPRQFNCKHSLHVLLPTRPASGPNSQRLHNHPEPSSSSSWTLCRVFNVRRYHFHSLILESGTQLSTETGQILHGSARSYLDAASSSHTTNLRPSLNCSPGLLIGKQPAAHRASSALPLLAWPRFLAADRCNVHNEQFREHERVSELEIFSFSLCTVALLRSRGPVFLPYRVLFDGAIVRDWMAALVECGRHHTSTHQP